VTRSRRGDEIPAFALTSPWAGSDAAAIPDAGVICRGEWQGRPVLGMRVSFDKRYITLAPVCTVFGLAFRLYDPEHLLGEESDLGITCALVPREHPGVDIGRRHLPLNAVWMNGPIRGRDVFMPLDFIIGGPKMAGQGWRRAGQSWRMLMECLAAGRSISLPGSNTGMQQLTARAVGAYARVRHQFKTAIGRFEGVQEALTRIGANTYLCDAARVMTAAAIDRGERPSVVSAIVKYHVTERARDRAGARNGGCRHGCDRRQGDLPGAAELSRARLSAGAGRDHGRGREHSHPQPDPVRPGGDSLPSSCAGRNAGRPQRRSRCFRPSLVGACRLHRVECRACAGDGAQRFALRRSAGGRCAGDTPLLPATHPFLGGLRRFSAAFAFIADVSMGTMGGALKRKEKLSARLGDILSLMYLASATLRRYEAEGRQAADAPLMHWAIWDAMFKTQNAFEGVIANFPNRGLAFILRSLVVFPLGRPYQVPPDRLGQEVAGLLIAPSPTRDRLTAAVHVPTDLEQPLGALEAALRATIEAEPIEARIRLARKQGRFVPAPSLTGDVDAVWSQARAEGLVSDDEFRLIAQRNRLRDKVIRVDDFPFDLDPAGAVSPSGQHGDSALHGVA